MFDRWQLQNTDPKLSAGRHQRYRYVLDKNFLPKTLSKIGRRRCQLEIATRIWATRCNQGIISFCSWIRSQESRVVIRKRSEKYTMKKPSINIDKSVDNSPLPWRSPDETLVFPWKQFYPNEQGKILDRANKQPLYHTSTQNTQMCNLLSTKVLGLQALEIRQ